MKLEPLADKVLIKPRAMAHLSDKGKILGATTLQNAVNTAYVETYVGQMPEQVGTVVAVGRRATKTGVSVGDTVLFSWQSGQELILDYEGTRVLVMLEDDLLAIIGQGVTIEAEALIV